MQTVNIYEARTQFSKLLEAVANGEEIMIVRFGRPAAMLMPVKVKKNGSSTRIHEG